MSNKRRLGPQSGIFEGDWDFCGKHFHCSKFYRSYRPGYLTLLRPLRQQDGSICCPDCDDTGLFDKIKFNMEEKP